MLRPWAVTLTLVWLKKLKSVNRGVVTVVVVDVVVTVVVVGASRQDMRGQDSQKESQRGLSKSNLSLQS